MDPSRSEGQLRYLCAGAVLAIGTVGELAAQMSAPLLPPPRNPTESSWCSRGRLAPEELGDP
jgi:hypothetical protein